MTTSINFPETPFTADQEHVIDNVCKLITNAATFACKVKDSDGVYHIAPSATQEIRDMITDNVQTVINDYADFHFKVAVRLDRLPDVVISIDIVTPDIAPNMVTVTG